MAALERGEESADPINVFIKPEPHKVAKLKEGRLRLISAVSFVDTMVDRVIFGWLLKSVLDSVGKIPVMVGWSPVYGNWRTFRACLSDKILCVDKTAWDWTVTEWLVKAYYQLVDELACFAEPWLRDLMRKRLRLLFERPIYQFRDGSVIRQTEAGVMKSGCLLTIILNSYGQLLVHAVATIRMGVYSPFPYAIGDDTAQDIDDDFDVERYCAELRKLGVIPKPEVLDYVSFAGFDITRDACVPAYRAKHLFRLEYSKHLKEYVEAMQMLYANSDLGYRIYSKVALNHCKEAYLPRHLAKKLMNSNQGDIRLIRQKQVY